MTNIVRSASAFIRIGFLVNPVAGVGGAAGFKGSDDEVVQNRVMSGELALKAPGRVTQFFSRLEKQLAGVGIEPDTLQLVCAPGVMGTDYVGNTFTPQSLPISLPEKTGADETRQLAQLFLEEGIDLLVFAGGDGTARDICSVIGCRLPVLGIPSGVKMHSGVFAVTPEAAADILVELLSGELTAVSEQEVRDIDEAAFRSGQVKSRHYGDMLVPCENRYMQHTKQGGLELEELVLLDMAADIRERLDNIEQRTLLILGPGSTTRFIASELGFETTLLGVDLLCWENGEGTLIARDMDDQQLLEALADWQGAVRLLITAIGGQGHIIGRGNQQISPPVLSRVGKVGTWVICTKTKLKTLSQRPLIVDSGDPQLDKQWAGFVQVICGYRDELLYPVGWHQVTPDPAASSASPAAPVNELVNRVIEQVRHRMVTMDMATDFPDSRRLFHGRGGTVPGLEWCSIDLYAPALLITLFSEPPEGFVLAVWQQLRTRLLTVTTCLVQRRYQQGAPVECLAGETPVDWKARRGQLQFHLSALQQNVGFFLDIEPARQWIEKEAGGAKVLNLFAYTCAFSIVALAAGADSVVNIDMSRRSLETGRRNHQLNQLATEQCRFLPHNIFKSWGKLKKLGPYDLVIIDPPSFQKGSFVAANDYQKVIRKMPDLVAEGGKFLACLNAPEVSASEFKQLVVEEAGSDFEFVRRLEGHPDFPDCDPEKSLKLLVFQRCRQL